MGKKQLYNFEMAISLFASFYGTQQRRKLSCDTCIRVCASAKEASHELKVSFVATDRPESC